MKLSALPPSGADLETRRDTDIANTGPYDTTLTSALCFAANRRYLQMALANPAIAAVIVPPELAKDALENDRGVGVAISPDPRAAFFRIHNQLCQQQRPSDAPVIDPSAQISPRAVIGNGAHIGGRVVIEDMAWIGPGSVIDDDVFVGQGAMVGTAGHFEQWFGDARGRVEHAGHVHLGAGCQVHAGAIIQRNVYATTSVIARDVVVGPRVSIGHGVNVGAGSVLTGGTVVAGFTTLGRDVWCGPGAIIGNNLTLGDGARVEIGAVVIKDVAPGARVSGNFATSHTQTLRAWAKRGKGQ